MNKFLLITVILVLSLQQGNAQISAPKMIKGKNPATAPPSVYSLTNARVSITTCSDNKEFSPEVTVWLIQKGKGILFQQPGANTRNEMQVNSTTEFGPMEILHLLFHPF